VRAGEVWREAVYSVAAGLSAGAAFFADLEADVLGGSGNGAGTGNSDK